MGNIECGKKKYPDKLAAQLALAWLMNKKSRRTEKSLYYCQKCKAYHLTKMRQYRRKRYDKRTRKK